LVKEEEFELKKRKRRKRSKKIRIEVTDDVLQQEEMFMSVQDFENRRVELPDFLLEEDWEEDDYEDDDYDDDDDQDDDYDDDYDDDQDTDEVEPFCNRACYVFNKRLERSKDDKCCVHCNLFLTLACPHLSDFMDDIDGLDPDD
jgi:hypothetical protein